MDSTSKKNCVILQDWTIHVLPRSKSSREIEYENKKSFLTGTVYGHPSIENGKKVVTSIITELMLKADYAKTRNGTVYILGRPAPSSHSSKVKR